jgi:hypothetical protein
MSFSVSVDTAAIKKLNDKMRKFPPAAIQAGMEAVTAFLEGEKPKLYPPQKGGPFQWSSDKQRRYVMMLLRARGGPPYKRTGKLGESVHFEYGKVSGQVPYIGAVMDGDVAPYARFVIRSQDQIIGHRKRGWKPINQFISDRHSKIVSVFGRAAKGAWDKLESIFGGFGL